MIMDNKKMELKLIVTHAKCSNCGTERILYFTSNNLYGERIVFTKSGKRCAYVNLFSEGIVQELEKYCKELCLENGINISSNKLPQIVSSIYGITCDEIDGEKIDTIPNTKCPNCLERRLVEDKDYGEQLTVVEADEVTHNSWEKLGVNERKEKVNGELHRQGFLEGNFSISM